MSRAGHTWIALLRGINVGGHRKVPMAELRELCARLRFEEVATYIQSGNVVFRAAQAKAAEVEAALARAIERRFGFDVSVMVRDVPELDAVVAGNPFLAEGVDDTSRLHVSFLGAEPPAAVAEEYRRLRLGGDELRLVGREAYLHVPGGMGKSKLTPTFLERALGTPGTARNWRTVNTLLEMGRGLL